MRGKKPSDVARPSLSWHWVQARTRGAMSPGADTSTTGAASAAHPKLAGYWAVLQDGLVSKVTRGENAGEQLRHDHVVGLYQPVEPWPGAQAHTTQLTVPAGGNPRVAFVVTNPTLTQPLQALVLQCPT